MKKNLLLIVVILLSATIGYSQAPGIFNYQGVARNSVGNVLVNKTITLRLTIHDGTAAGPVVYQESRTAVTNPFGLFNVQVGSPGAANVTGTIAGVPWVIGNKFIQVEIDPNGGTTFLNIGTAQIASVPYAWYATIAGDLVLPFIKTQAAPGTTLIGLTNSATTGTQGAFTGVSASTDGNAFAISGTISSTSPGGFSAGLRGVNNGTSGLGIGVYGSQAGSGWGVYGIAPAGIGVNGSSTSGNGVSGSSSSGTGGRFTTTSGLALHTTNGVRLEGINEGLNRILGSDAIGNANWFDPAALGLVTGTGTLNFVPKWTPNGTNLGNSNIFDDGTNVGVFTTTPTARLHAISALTTGGPSAILGESDNQDGNTSAVQGVINSTAPGGFSAGLRGVNNGTGGLGIGVYGSQAGSGWGVYGTTPAGIGVYGSSASGYGIYGSSTTGVGVYGNSSNGHSGQFEITNMGSTGDAIRASQLGLGRAVYAAIDNTSNIVAAVRGETNGGGYGVFGQATGNGNAGFFQIANPSSTSTTVNVTTNGIGSGITVQQTNASNGARGVDVLQAGVGPGVFATSAGGNAVWGITSSISAAGVIGDNTFGEAVVGRNRGGIGVGAVVGRNDSTGYGVRGFNTKNGIGVLGQTGISGGTGTAGRFENVNASNTTTTLQVATNGIGGGIVVDMPNASNGARGVDVNQQGVGPGVFSISQGGTGVWGITSSISAAGVIGDNTFGEAVVGRNRGGNGVGAVVGRNDSTGYGVRGFNTKDGIGVLGQTGISGGTGRAARFENVNAANSSNVVEIAGNGTGTSLLVTNANGAATNLAIFSKSGSGNVARIASNGEIFANGGFTVGGADLAEYFAVEGPRDSYEPGDVLVISQTSDRKVEKSSTAYSTLVTGVYATKPGMKLTEENAVDADLSHLVPMGVIGVIPTKVCLEGGAIKRGDLLVTSSITGVAMKADLDKVKVGQVLGKALQDYNADGIGKINVMVSVK